MLTKVGVKSGNKISSLSRSEIGGREVGRYFTVEIIPVELSVV